MGHRSEIRSVCFSHDDSLVLSTSSSILETKFSLTLSDGCKVWSVSTKNCVRTMDDVYGLCGTFVPGNKHVIVGTRQGHLILYDLAAATIIQDTGAHTSPIWSLYLHPDKTRFVTGSGDKTIKFWDLRLVKKGKVGITVHDEWVMVPQSKELEFKETRTLSMSDEVLCVKYSPNGNLLAAALLDSTVKIFRAETLEFYLSLYGHKLPVMTLDISFDSLLIATGSADKNIKVIISQIHLDTTDLGSGLW